PRVPSEPPAPERLDGLLASTERAHPEHAEPEQAERRGFGNVYSSYAADQHDEVVVVLVPARRREILPSEDVAAAELVGDHVVGTVGIERALREPEPVGRVEVEAEDTARERSG